MQSTNNGGSMTTAVTRIDRVGMNVAVVEEAQELAEGPLALSLGMSDADNGGMGIVRVRTWSEGAVAARLNEANVCDVQWSWWVLQLTLDVPEAL